MRTRGRIEDYGILVGETKSDGDSTMKYRMPGDVDGIGKKSVLLPQLVRGITCGLIILLILSVISNATAQITQVPPDVRDGGVPEQQPKQGEEMTTPSGVTIRFAAPRPPAQPVRARSQNPSAQQAAEAASLNEPNGSGKSMFVPMRNGN